METAYTVYEFQCATCANHFFSEQIDAECYNCYEVDDTRLIVIAATERRYSRLLPLLDQYISKHAIPTSTTFDNQSQAFYQLSSEPYAQYDNNCLVLRIMPRDTGVIYTQMIADQYEESIEVILYNFNVGFNNSPECLLPRPHPLLRWEPMTFAEYVYPSTQASLPLFGKEVRSTDRLGGTDLTVDRVRQAYGQGMIAPKSYTYHFRRDHAYHGEEWLVAYHDNGAIVVAGYIPADWQSHLLEMVMA